MIACWFWVIKFNNKLSAVVCDSVICFDYFSIKLLCLALELNDLRRVEAKGLLVLSLMIL